MYKIFTSETVIFVRDKRFDSRMAFSNHDQKFWQEGEDYGEHGCYCIQYLRKGLVGLLTDSQCKIFVNTTINNLRLQGIVMIIVLFQSCI